MDNAIQFLVDQVVSLKGDHLSTIAGETSLRDLALDSLDVLELVMTLEEHFLIELDPADLGRCETIADLAELIECSIKQND